MGITNFPNGLMAAGTYLPGGPGMYIPPGGSHFWVKPYSGNDSNSGATPDEPLKTVAKAYDLCTANKNDVVHLMAEHNDTSSYTTDYWSAKLTWAKDQTHLVGECVPTRVSQRARIAQLSTATGIDGLLTVSADNCIFANFSIFQGVNDATSTNAVTLTGDRCQFANVHFAGIGHAGMIAHASAADVTLNGAHENTFENCTFGLDTIDRDASCANLRFTAAGGSARNYFKGCLFQAYLSVAGYHVVVGATGIDRWAIFENCRFISDSTNRGVSQTAVFSTTNMTQGQILLFGCTTTSNGTPDWIASGSDGGLIQGDMVAAAAACAGGLGTKGAA